MNERRGMRSKKEFEGDASQDFIKPSRRGGGKGVGGHAKAP
jgi:hypothetical protein